MAQVFQGTVRTGDGLNGTRSRTLLAAIGRFISYPLNQELRFIPLLLDETATAEMQIKLNFPTEPERCYPGVMNEIIFEIREEEAEGGFVARALGHSIVTQADTWEELRNNVRDAVRCHFDEDQAPRVIRLHRVHEEVLALG